MPTAKQEVQSAHESKTDIEGTPVPPASRWGEARRSICLRKWVGVPISKIKNKILEKIESCPDLFALGV